MPRRRHESSFVYCFGFCAGRMGVAQRPFALSQISNLSENAADCHGVQGRRTRGRGGRWFSWIFRDLLTRQQIRLGPRPDGA